MEHKTLAFEIKSVDYEGRTLEGYAAAFGNIDQVGDIIHPGAFKKTLTERGQRIKFLWQHDPTEPIGKLIEAREDSGGLFVKAIISDTQRGRDALALLKDKAIGEMSIGYDTVKGAMDYTKDTLNNTVRNLREIKLYEFSLVTFPANEQAVVTALKEQDVTPSDTQGGDPTSQRKSGRVISAANIARLKAARDAIDELMSMGIIPDDEEEDEPLDKETKNATIIASQVDEPQSDTLTTENAAGPVKPPTEVLLKLIDLELSELTH